MTDTPPPPPPGGANSDPSSTPPPAATPPPVAPAAPSMPPPPVVPMQTKAASNGLAIASLILGIVSLVLAAACGAGALFGIIGVVLAVLGMNRAKALAGMGRGMAIAGLILSILGIVLSIILYIVLFAIADNASDEISSWTGKADPSEYSIDVQSCNVDSLGYPTMKVTVKNKTSKDKSWTFDYEFRSGGSIVDKGTTFPETIPANDSMVVEVNSFSDTSGTVKCEVTGVNNWFN